MGPHDESSHYEVSLTGAQALIAFVLLLFSLGASFAFGIVVGKGRGEEPLVVRQERPVITEASAAASQSARIVELGTPEPVSAETRPAPAVKERQPAAVPESKLIDEVPPRLAESAPAPAASEASAGTTYYAQLLSTGEAQKAEAVAAKLIDGGFPNAFVDRAVTEQGTMYRVRVKYPSEAAARAGAEQLKPFAAGEVWVTSR